jgi:hypothetical protein
MAKKSSLPKVISKANKDISTILENNIQKESQLLKELVDEVIQSNLEVKKRNNQRITETKRKLNELDNQIDDLNMEIELVDRETIIQQLNEMIDAENKIFNARQEIRYFDNETLPERIQTLDQVYQNLISGQDQLLTTKQYKEALQESNKAFLSLQVKTTKDINTIMTKVFQAKKDYIDHALSQLEDIKDSIHTKETLLSLLLHKTIETSTSRLQESAGLYSNKTTSKDQKQEALQALEDKKATIIQELQDLKDKTQKDKEQAIKDYQDYVETIKLDFEKSNKEQLEKEQAIKEQVEQEMKRLQFDMMQASRLGELETAADLLKEYEALKKKANTKTVLKVEKKTKTSTKKKRQETEQYLKDLYLTFTKEKFALEEALQRIEIERQESSILYKFQSDYNALKDSSDAVVRHAKDFKAFRDQFYQLRRDIIELKHRLRVEELKLLQDNEENELDLIHSFEEALTNLKRLEIKRQRVLLQSTSTLKTIQKENEYRIKQAILDIKLSQEINEIDKRILQKRNETLIKNESLKEEINSEIIYQESLIKIAQKEHELQLIKVKSLYENERNLAEEQVERINLGVKVNETFVKTTLKNQMLFATQQINCAESEYDIRVESINLTFDQEVQYANKKIEYYKQKYEYDKNKLQKELEDKLEDLQYKLLLFTGDKERNEISKKIKEITDHYEDKIDDIIALEDQDENILRYEKVINDATNRQEQAIAEAVILKEKTVASFEQLLDATKLRFEDLDETKTSDTSNLAPMIGNSAISSADQRLQKAIKEADELYNERVKKPKEIIEELKRKMNELTLSVVSDAFVDEQKALKKDKLKEHNEVVTALIQEKNTVIKELKEQDTILRLNDFDDSDIIVRVRAYRSKEDIIQDYNRLKVQQERLKLDQLQDLEDHIKDYDILLKETQKGLAKGINKPIKPYKTFLDKSSKVYTKQKKKLAKRYSVALKKALKENGFTIDS